MGNDEAQEHPDSDSSEEESEEQPDMTRMDHWAMSEYNDNYFDQQDTDNGDLRPATDDDDEEETPSGVAGVSQVLKARGRGAAAKVLYGKSHGDACLSKALHSVLPYF